MDTEREGRAEAMPEPKMQVGGVEYRRSYTYVYRSGESGEVAFENQADEDLITIFRKTEPVGPATGDTLCQELGE